VSRRPRVLARPASLALIAALAITLLPGGAPRPVAAVSPDLVISQVYGAGGNAGATLNADYVELFNRGASAASLDGMSIQYASATGTGNFGSSATALAALPNASVPPGGYFLVQMSAAGANGAPLPTPDFIDTTPVLMAAGAGKVALATGTDSLGCNGSATQPCSSDALARIRDLVGYGTGTTGANFFEGTAAAPTLSPTTAAFRANGGATDTDDNAADFTAATPNPRTGADPAPTVLSTTPADGAVDVAVATTISITFSEPVTVDSGAFTLSCDEADVPGVTGGSGTAWTFDPTADLPQGVACVFAIAGGGVHDSDTKDPPDTLGGDVVVDFTTVGPGDPCDNPFTPIPSIQGSGAAAAITGTVTTEGVVTGIVDYSNGTGSFFIQDPVGDADPATSDGIFVFVNTAGLVSVGDAVRVTGFARERFNQTSLNGSNGNTAPVTDILVCGTGTVVATEVTLPAASATAFERYEGMLVTFQQTLVISEYFNYDRFGEIVLALPLGDEDRPFTGTAIDEPGAPANARTAANALSRITLDDNNPNQNPPLLRHPNGQPFSLSNLFRGGDHVTDATGVLGWDFNLYRIFPTAPADYEAQNPRPTAPEPVGGTLRAAAMNTLNFFLTGDAIQDDSPTPNNPADDVCGGNANLECRGFDTNQPTEFTRQRDKLVQALAGLDADVIGLNELENTPMVDPLLDAGGVVPGLNALDGVGPYDAIETGVIGTDAIRVGLIYRSDRVVPVGEHAVLDSTVDPRFLDSKSRPVLAQTFEDLETGARFTVAVNHLKSKGSDCNDVGDPDVGDGQGNCNETRTAAAQALVDWLASDPTGTGETDVLILGDLNSYAKEDPIDAILAGSDDEAGTGDDYTNLIFEYQGTYAHSYVFDGQAGYLDHALASASMAAQVTGATDWHINADESDVVDYDTTFKPAAQEALYEANAYRASDHDPVIVGLDAASDRPTVDAGGPYEVIEGGTVGLDATGSDPTGDDLTYAWDLDGNGSFETSGANVTFEAGSLQAPQTVVVTVEVTDEHGQSSTDTAEIRIIWDFGGFQAPSTPGGVTQIKAGAAHPVKFSLDGPQGGAVLDGNPIFQRHACPTGADIGAPIPTTASEPFAYDASTDTYRFTWKTQKAWAGWCGTLTLVLADGETYDLEVRFKP
jgi:predicted extracellular nuclease